MKPLPGNSPGSVDSNTVVPVLFDTDLPRLVRRRRLRRDRRSAPWCRRPSCRSPRPTCSPATSTSEYLNRDATPAQEATVSKIASLVVKVGAVLVILLIDPQFSIDLQLIGGVIILQTLPAVAIAPLHPLVPPLGHWSPAGSPAWASGMWMLYQIPNAGHRDVRTSAARRSRCPSGSTRQPSDLSATVYVGFVAVLANLAVAAVVTLLCRAGKVADGVDRTSPDDYFVDEGEPRLVGPTADELGSPGPASVR